MTVIEYAEKLGIELTDSQKGMLNIWQESDNKSAIFILSMPRCEGRQMIYDLIQRYRGYEQGRLDAIDEFAAKILMKANYFNLDTEDIEEFNENVEKVVYSVVDELKEQSNDI